MIINSISQAQLNRCIRAAALLLGASLLGQAASAQTATAREWALQQAEVQLNGTVALASHSTFSIYVSSITQPDGSTAQPGRTLLRVVRFANDTLLHVRGAKEMITRNAIKRGDSVVAIGTWNSDERIVTPREVAVWSMTDNGTFQLDHTVHHEAPTPTATPWPAVVPLPTATPLATPASTPEVAPANLPAAPTPVVTPPATPVVEATALPMPTQSLELTRVSEEEGSGSQDAQEVAEPAVVAALPPEPQALPPIIAPANCSQLGLRIAQLAYQRHQMGAVAAYQHMCQSLVRTTVQQITPQFNRYFRDTARKTMCAFQNAGIGHSYKRGMQLLPGDLLYTGQWGGVYGHAMIMGPSGHVLDNVGIGSAAPCNRPIDWVVRPTDRVRIACRR